MQKVNRSQIGTFILITALITSIFFPSFIVEANEHDDESNWNASVDVPTDKTWVVTFNSFLDLATVNNENIYIKNGANQTIQTDISTGQADNEVIISPPEDGYVEGETYSLHITTDVKDELGNPLQEGIHKAFMIKREEVATVEHTENTVFLPEDTAIILESDSDEAGEKGEDLGLSPEVAKDLKVGDIVIIEPNTTSPDGLARKIEKITENDDEVVLSTSIPFLNEVIKELDFSQSIVIDASHIEQDSLPEEITVRDFKEYDRETASFFEGLEFTLNDFPMVVGNDKMLVSGKIQLQNPILNPIFKLSKSKTSFDQLKFTLQTTIVTKLSFNANVSVKLGKPISFKEKEVPFGKLTVPIPQPPGLQLSGSLGGVIKNAAIGEYHASISNTTLAEVGVIKKGKSYEAVRIMENNTTISHNGQGGLETKIGLRAALNVHYLKLKAVTLSTDAGAYGNAKLIKGKLISGNNETRTCTKAEIGVYHDIGVSFPSFPFPFNKTWGLYGYKLPIADLSNCESLQSIQFNTDEIDIESGSTRHIEVTATYFDFSLGESLLKKVTKDTTFKSSDPSVTIAPNGRIRVDGFQSAKKVTITANYDDGEKKKQETLIVNVKKDPTIPDLPNGKALKIISYVDNYEVKNSTGQGKQIKLAEEADYAIYNANGTVREYRKGVKSVYLSPNTVGIVSFQNKQSKPIEKPEGVTINSTTEEALLNVFQRNVTTEWLNNVDYSNYMQIGKSTYDYVSFDSKGSASSFNQVSNQSAYLATRANGKVVISAGDKIVNIWTPKRNFTMKESQMPALIKQEIKPGETYTFANNQKFSSSVKVTGEGMYDYVRYYKSGGFSSYQQQVNSRQNFTSIQNMWSGEKVTITNTGNGVLQVFTPNKQVNVHQEKDEALMKQLIKPGEIYTFANNQSFSSSIKVTGEGMYDYVRYYKSGGPSSYQQQVNSRQNFTSIQNAWSGEKVTITNTGNGVLQVFAPAKNFDVYKEQQEALKRLVIKPGETYTLVNNQKFSSSVKLTGGGTYDYVSYRGSDKRPNYFENQQLQANSSQSLSIWSNEELSITNKQGTLLIYFPQGLLNIKTREALELNKDEVENDNIQEPNEILTDSLKVDREINDTTDSQD